MITTFLQQGFVDTLILSIIPIILGGGISLFQAVGKQIPLRLLSSRDYPFGLVQLKCEVL